MAITTAFEADRSRTIIGAVTHAGNVWVTKSAWFWREIFAALALVTCIWCAGIEHDPAILMKLTIDWSRLQQQREQYARILTSVRQAYPPEERLDRVERASPV